MRKRIIIRDRLKRSFLYVALIPAILFLTAFGIYAGVNTWKQSTENLTKQMSRAQQELNQLLEEAAQVARTVADDRQIIDAMSENFHRDRDRFLSEIIINNELSYISRYFDSRLQVYIVSENGALYKNGSLMFSQNDYRNEDWYLSVQGSDRAAWFPLHKGSRMVDTLGGNYAALGIPLRSSRGDRTLGVLLVEALVDEVLKDLDTGSSYRYIIAPDMEMRIIDGRVHQYEEEAITVLEHGNYEVLEPGEALPGYVKTTMGVIGYWRSNFKHFDVTQVWPYRICYAMVDTNQWILVNCVPYLSLYRFPMIIIALLLVGIALLLLFVSWSANRISTTFTEPIIALNETAHRVGDGDFNLSIEKAGDDEIGDLSDEFNRMIRHVKRLMEQVMEEQEIQRNYELLLLQAQINPHFLYNTLDSIVWLTRMKRNDEAVVMLEALIAFFRSGLSKGQDVVPLSQEVQNVRSYMTIQAYRYRTKITWDVECDEDIEGFQMPRLILQPLVENAIYHGIKEKDGAGHISVACWQEEDAVMLRVKDDGLGMSAETLEALRGHIDAREVHERKSYGVTNVIERLQLFYHDRCRFDIESAPNEGTCVTIEIKVEAET